MEAARRRRRDRRLGRGGADKPLDTRLVRVGFVLVAPALAALLFTVTIPGTLPRAPLEPLFDGVAAEALARTLATEYPARVPGTVEAEGAARWYTETVSAHGLSAEEDVWTEDIPDLGRVTLRNVTTVVAGRSEGAIVIVAHRDNAGAGGSWDNASGTAALVELARGFAPQDVGPDPLPQHTLVLVSTDGGAYGGAGARRFAASSPYARDAIAAVVLDGLGGRGRPRLEIAADAAVSPSRILVRTAWARVGEEAGVTPTLPHAATQLVDLGVPYALNEQGRLLAAEVAAITLTTPAHDTGAEATVTPADEAAVRLDRLGGAAEALVDSLDSSIGGPLRTPDTLFLGERAASGWAVRLLLVVLVVPFALGVVDLVTRGWRKRLPYRPALRALRTRFGIWMVAGGLVAIGALLDVLPTGASLPLPPFSPYVTDPPLAGILFLTIAFGLAWLLGRRRIVPRGAAGPDEQLAGFAAALVLLGGLAVVLAVTKPYALVFVLPSLYAWLSLVLGGPAWRRVALFFLGLAGPIIGLWLIASAAELSIPRAALYVLGLATTGYVSVWSVLAALVWATAAAQVAALAFGRYGPYAGGVEPPPPGVVRGAIRELAR